MSALNNQVGGNHYSKLPVQPLFYSMENKMDACQHTIIKYVTRFRDKGGIEDLRKAKHTLEWLIEYEEGKKAGKKEEKKEEKKETETNTAEAPKEPRALNLLPYKVVRSVMDYVLMQRPPYDASHWSVQLKRELKRIFELCYEISSYDYYPVRWNDYTRLSDANPGELIPWCSDISQYVQMSNLIDSFPLEYDVALDLHTRAIERFLKEIKWAGSVLDWCVFTINVNTRRHELVEKEGKMQIMPKEIKP